MDPAKSPRTIGSSSEEPHRAAGGQGRPRFARDRTGFERADRCLRGDYAVEFPGGDVIILNHNQVTLVLVRFGAV